MCNPALPKSLRIGAFDVKVTQWTDEQSTMTGHHGEWSELDMEIRVHIDKNLLVTADTVWHEVNHAICSLYHISEEDDEERMVTMLSSAWIQVMRDNIGLLDWLRATLGVE